MNKKAFLLPLFLIGMAASALAKQDPVAANAEYIAKYSSKNAYIKAGSALNTEICEEGFTLLKNLDGYLPMSGDEKISIFGKSSTDLAYGGGGSGSGRVNGETAVDLQKSLTSVGFSVNPSLTNFYKNNDKSGIGRTNGNSGWKGISQVQIGETPISQYDDALINSFDEYNDAAIIVLSREGSEGCDVKPCDARDFIENSKLPNNQTNKSFCKAGAVTDKHALQLSDNEEALFEMVKEHFDNIIVIINSGNAFQLDQFENDNKVKGIVWVGNPGAVGIGALGRILKGEVNPSGHTVDTWARKFKNDPTFVNFSENSQNNPIYAEDGTLTGFYSADTMFNADGTPVRSPGTLKKTTYSYTDAEHKVVEAGLNGVKPSAYVSYEEGIYFDYHYYETMYRNLLAQDQQIADDWYASERGVIYPFGYGLSYTTFEQKIISASKANQTLKDVNEKISVKVRVTNTGEVAGKEVVQLYWKAPYKEDGIEKAYNALCAFDKTNLLEPGESQDLVLTFFIADVANYDFTDANNNGFKGYELEAGNYELTLNKNAHEELARVKYKVASKGIQFENDRYTNNKVENRFTDRGFYSSLPGENDIGFEQMSRKDLDETFPHAPTFEERTLKEGSDVQDYYCHEFKMVDIDVDQNTDYVPAVCYKTKEDIEELGWEQAETAPSAANSIKFDELVGLDFDDPKWDEFMNQMTWSEMIPFVLGGNNQNPAITRANKPQTGSSDGPSQFLIIWWAGAPIVAATYNVELAHEQGEMVGIESHLNGTFGWAGPAVNLHRSPFGGRNFEYYSADPFISGRMAARVVAGATEKGVYCYFKHFAVNDQERNREGVSAFLTEQALRECYLKPFQMVVQEGKATGIMSSYNRLGLMETAASYPLLTEVLREEWGFTGSIISDMTHHGNSNVNFNCYENIHNRVLAGCNNQLDSSSFADNLKVSWDSTQHCPVFTNGTEKVPTYSFWYAVRKSVKETLYMVLRCGAMVKNNFVQQINEIEVTGLVDNVYSSKLGDNVNISLSAPEEYNGQAVESVEYEVDAYTPLPAGLELNDNVISGKAEAETNQFVRLIATFTLEDGSEVKCGRTFELFITKNVHESKMISPNASNAPAGVIIGVSAGGVVLVAAAVLVVLLLLKKKKVD